MKFTHLTIEGFGGVSGELSIDLNADVVVIVGQNGFGKTTVCDALAWALTGVHPRGAIPKSLYSVSGACQVTLTGSSSAGTFRVTRRTRDGDVRGASGVAEDSVVLQAPNGESFNGDSASRWVSENLLVAQDHADFASAMTTLTDSFYMQQESLRDYLTRRDDDQRFLALSRMVGAGSLSGFLTEFESSHRSWKKAVKQLSDELREPRDQLAHLRSERERLSQELNLLTSGPQSSGWSAWWTKARAILGPAMAAEEPALTSFALEDAVNGLGERLRVLQSRSDQLASLQAEMSKPTPEFLLPDKLERMKRVHEKNVSDLALAEERLTVIQASVSAAESALSELATSREELAALAEIAKRHIGDDCPVCGQAIDLSAVTKRLETLSQGGGDRPPPPEYLKALSHRSDQIESVTTMRTLVGSSARELHWAQEQADSRRLILQRRRERLQELLGVGVEWADAGPVVSSEVSKTNSLINEVTDLMANTENFRSATRRDLLVARLNVLGPEIDAADASLRSSESDLLAREATSREAEFIIKSLRDDAEAFVRRRLDDVQPLLDQIYSAVDPHPTFRAVGLATRQRYGKHRLDPVLEDDVNGVQVSDPGRTLSTSQANALAVALFLAFNLGLMPSRLESVVLDDPLQNLDDIHLLGLVDVMRRILPRRQIIVTTHDQAFASLLVRKLRPGAGGLIRKVEISKWDRSGPAIKVTDEYADVRPWKIATAG